MHRHRWSDPRLAPLQLRELEAVAGFVERTGEPPSAAEVSRTLGRCFASVRVARNALYRLGYLTPCPRGIGEPAPGALDRARALGPLPLTRSDLDPFAVSVLTVNMGRHEPLNWLAATTPSEPPSIPSKPEPPPPPSPAEPLPVAILTAADLVEAPAPAAGPEDDDSRPMSVYMAEIEARLAEIRAEKVARDLASLRPKPNRAGNPRRGRVCSPA